MRLLKANKEHILNKAVKASTEKAVKVLEEDFETFIEKLKSSIYSKKELAWAESCPTTLGDVFREVSSIKLPRYLQGVLSKYVRFDKIKVGKSITCLSSTAYYFDIVFDKTQEKTFSSLNSRSVALAEKIKNIRSKTKTALSSINTVKQLKDNYPSLYEYFEGETVCTSLTVTDKEIKELLK